MRCDEFEAALQLQADDRHSRADEAALRQHAQGCPACRELQDGFRLVAQAFAASRMPDPSRELTERIVAAAVRTRPVRLWWRARVSWVAAAAALLLAVGVWFLPRPTDRDETLLSSSDHSPLTTHHSPTDELLFPELASADGTDSREETVLAQAVEPVSEIFRAVGRSFTSPVRPIAAATTEAVTNLFGDLPEPDLPSIPGMGEMMGPPIKKNMPDMGPSS